ncbi:hypothetical protein AAMO2058_000713000 [Amorphochlora amoebiformis]
MFQILGAGKGHVLGTHRVSFWNSTVCHAMAAKLETCLRNRRRLGKTALIELLEMSIWEVGVKNTADILLSYHPWLLPDKENWQKGRIIQASPSQQPDPNTVPESDRTLGALHRGRGASLLHLVSWAAGRNVPKGVRKEALNMAERLIQEGANPNAKTFDGFTPLHIAVQSISPSMITLLLVSGARPDLHNAFETTPMDLAMVFGVEALPISRLLVSWQKKHNRKLQRKIQSFLTTSALAHCDLKTCLKIADKIYEYSRIADPSAGVGSILNFTSTSNWRSDAGGVEKGGGGGQGVEKRIRRSVRRAAKRFRVEKDGTIDLR